MDVRRRAIILALKYPQDEIRRRKLEDSLWMLDQAVLAKEQGVVKDFVILYSDNDPNVIATIQFEK